jgi:hypothetical protein
MLITDSKKVYCKPLSNADFILLQAIGTEVCSKIKEAYPDKKWTEIAELYGKVKERMRNFYSHLSEIEMHKELRKYLVKDILEIMENKT